MPQVEYCVETAAPLNAIWDFVKDIDNWAPFLTGYQSHEKLNEDESIWFVKGELGGMTRVAEFHVHVTEWAGPERVSFTLDGLQEPVTGSGTFQARALDDPAAGSTMIGARKPGWFSALITRMARALLRIVTGGGPKTPERQSTPVAGAMRSSLTFRLSLNAGGMTGPVLNLLLAPMLRPVAEDLANRITGRIETDLD